MSTEQLPSGFVKALTEQEIETLKAFYGVFSQRDYTVVDTILAPDWQDIPLAPGQQEGSEGYKKLVQGFVQAFSDVEVNIHEIFGSHERAGVRAEMVFTHNNEFLGIPASGKKLRVSIHEFHHIKDGKLVKTWHLEDWLGMFVQTGSWPVSTNQ
ncbi:steroid delta-isomerase-like uncharacterized protein [Sphingobacterium zeae]|uniref:Steroid delta-isomerase-like uncharacterized protein n=1 Tax=Sphingobacterium zeae TaxID=1776859 RepID=A0ABU0U8C3_9SPHI|nr:ester cyclase [Sphingobacterium zeae]MDQ1151215.1 steroid delta-isomerase-like uncharacterized protein [Sphingobacterium zeae]